MKTRHVYNFFDKVNTQVFDNKLPKVKINLSTKAPNCYGTCRGKAYRHQEVIASIVLYPKTMVRVHPNIPLEESMKLILVHEMVHLWQYTIAGTGVFNIMKNNKFNWHDVETFDHFGQLACDKGLLLIPDLLTE